MMPGRAMGRITRSEMDSRPKNRARDMAAAHSVPSTSASSSRGFNETLGTVATTHQAGLQAAWEIDLFGGNRLGAQAAQARLDGAQAGEAAGVGGGHRGAGLVLALERQNIGE